MARLYDCHAVRPLRQALQGKLLWPRLLQIAHHPQPVCTCSSRSSIPLAPKSNTEAEHTHLSSSRQLEHAWPQLGVTIDQVLLKMHRANLTGITASTCGESST